MKSVVICGNYGASNLGDEALLDGILLLTRSAYADVSITVMSANPKETARLHAVQSVHLIPSGIRSLMRSFSGGFLETLATIRRADLFIMGGGGLFTDEKFMAILIWSIQALFVSRRRTRVFCLGQSVGPLRTQLGRILARRFFQKCQVVSVRDSLSADLLQQTLGISNVQTFADPALVLPFDTLNPPRRDDFIILTLRPWLSHELSNQHHHLAAFVDWVFETYGLRTKMVPFQDFQDQDFPELQKVRNLLKHPDCVDILAYKNDYREVIQLLAESRAVVGMRLHSLLFSVLTETPFLALSYSQKIDGLLHDLQLEDYSLSWEKLTFSGLKQKFTQVMTNWNHLHQDLQVKHEKLRSLTLQQQHLFRP